MTTLTFLVHYKEITEFRDDPKASWVSVVCCSYNIDGAQTGWDPVWMGPETFYYSPDIFVRSFRFGSHYKQYYPSLFLSLV